jgi:hypothetical protein
MHAWKVPGGMGWGNVVLSLVDVVTRFPNVLVHSSINDIERGVEFIGLEYVDTMDGFLEVKSQIFINQRYFQTVHSNIPKIIRPNEHMRGLIEKYRHLVDGVTCGIHIRRGAYQADSKNIGCHGLDKNGEPVPAYFATDSALEKFKKIVQTTPGKVFLASDSREVKHMFKDVNFLDTDAVLTYKCDTLKNYDVTPEDRLNCYLEWFLLSMCPKLYITAGESDLSGLSTYGYAAGCYGGCPIEFVFN